jgi:FdhD protein
MIEKAEAKEAEALPILRFTRENHEAIEKRTAAEFPLTIILNDNELVTLLCSPIDLRYLSVGFLYSEGFINNKSEIRRITVDDERGVVRLDTFENKAIEDESLFKRIISSGCGRGISFYSASDTTSKKVESSLKISVEEIFTLVDLFQHSSQLYQVTGGVHSAALCDLKSVLVFSEDVGRHNAIDKIFGKCLLEDIATDDRVIVTSGRITSEILHKVARRAIPVVISIAAPTNLGVKISDALGITLVASVRGKKMDVYTNPARIIPAK